MFREIIVTDLTCFHDDRICLAGVDPTNGELIRPMPYLNQEQCIKGGILPGSKIRAEFVKIADAKPPHAEDYKWQNSDVVGSATCAEFHDLLTSTLSASIRKGFDITINDKFIPVEKAPARSIITVKTMVKLHPGYGNDLAKIKASITDAEDVTLQYLTITDFGFHRFAQKIRWQAELDRLDHFINSQIEIFIRLGLTRPYDAKDGRAGYWLQINGIYTFPKFLKALRSYE